MTRRQAECCDQIGGRRPVLDLSAFDLLARDLLLDRLQDALPVRPVVLGMKLGRGELADQPLGECPLLVTDLRLGALVDLGRVVDLAGELEPLEEESVLVPADRDRRCVAAPGEGAHGDALRLF